MAETMQERLARLKREKEEAKAADTSTTADTVAQITHQDDGEPDFAAIAEELEARKAEESKGENIGFTKDTIYIRDDIYKAFNALCIKQGDKKRLTNEALSDFIAKRYREMQQ